MSQNEVASDPFQRQVCVQRQNLIQICRLAVKSLIDKSCTDDITENCEELVNFIAVIENVFMFQLKPQRAWYKSGEAYHFWHYILAACKKLCGDSIRNIESIENIRSNTSKSRAWIRMALMEKRLAEYVTAAQADTDITKMFYWEGAIIGGDDGVMLGGLLVGLNTIDFSFCLKGSNRDIIGPLVIDYSKYIDYHESGEEELEEQDVSTNATNFLEESMDDETNLVVRYKMLEQRYRGVAEQKHYLEELVRIRSTQLQNVDTQRQALYCKLQQRDIEARLDMETLENVILELQQQLVDAKDQSRCQQMEIVSLRSRLRTTSTSSEKVHDKMMQKIVTAEEMMAATAKDDGDAHNTTNSTATQTIPHRDPAPETFSMVPLAGSITSDHESKIVSNPDHDLQMSVIQTGTEGSQESTDSDTSEQSTTFEVILHDHIDGAGIEGEVEVKGES